MVLLIVNYQRKLIEKLIARQHPDWSDAERKIAFIERMYRNDFSPEEMERIRQSFIAQHQQA